MTQPLDFSNQDLRDRSFKGRKDLAGADFRKADIRGCNFSNANLDGADFSGVTAGKSGKQIFIGRVVALVVVVVIAFIGASAFAFAFEVTGDFVAAGAVVGAVTVVSAVVFAGAVAGAFAFIEPIWYLAYMLQAFQVSRFRPFWYTKPHDPIKSLNCRINGGLKAIYFVQKDTKWVL